jgi:GH43 family beta-xylosidase
MDVTSLILGSFNGILSALIFAVKSEEAQQRWYYFFFPRKNQTNMDDFDDAQIKVDFEDDAALTEEWTLHESMDHQPSDLCSSDRYQSSSSPSTNPMIEL